MSNSDQCGGRLHRLHVVGADDLPTSLYEYANTPVLVGAALTQKLGSGAYWLVANCMYGLEKKGDTEARLLERTERFVLPVRFEGLREVQCSDRQILLPPIFTSQLAHEDRLAIFGLRQDVVRRSKLLIRHGFTRFAEVGVELQDNVTLLDEGEYDIPLAHRI